MKTKAVDNLRILLSFLILILTYDTNVSDTAGNTLWNVVITEKEHFQREVGALHEQGALAWTHFDVRFRKEIHAVLIEAAF